jgi:hypothetical protein
MFQCIDPSENVPYNWQRAGHACDIYRATVRNGSADVFTIIYTRARARAIFIARSCLFLEPL